MSEETNGIGSYTTRSNTLAEKVAQKKEKK